jgi:hypothetical protein
LRLGSAIQGTDGVRGIAPNVALRQGSTGPSIALILDQPADGIGRVHTRAGRGTGGRLTDTRKRPELG